MTKSWMNTRQNSRNIFNTSKMHLTKSFIGFDFGYNYNFQLFFCFQIDLIRKSYLSAFCQLWNFKLYLQNNLL